MPQENRTILVVDDDFDFRESLGYVLADSGYKVVSAADGQEALSRLRTGPLPCLILLDLMMPGMNGWQFRTEQKQDESLRSIPVLVLSGDAKAEEEARSLDVAGCLKKPVPLDDLLDLIQRYC
jgi:CheY-like chemotaxis protein